MKKNKALSRSFIALYFIWLFGGFIAPLLSIYFSSALAIVFLVFTILSLAFIIYARVMYVKNKNHFVISSITGVGILDILVFIGFILEIVISASLDNKNSYYYSPYPWIVIILSILGLIPINYFLIKNIKEIIEKNNKEKKLLLESEEK